MKNLIGIFVSEITADHDILSPENYLLIETKTTRPLTDILEQLSQVHTIVVSVESGGLSVLTQLMDANEELDCKIVLVGFGVAIPITNRKEAILIDPLRCNKIPEAICEWDKHLVNIHANIFARSYVTIKSKYRYIVHPPNNGIIRQLTDGFRRIAAAMW